MTKFVNVCAEIGLAVHSRSFSAFSTLKAVLKAVIREKKGKPVTSTTVRQRQPEETHQNHHIFGHLPLNNPKGISIYKKISLEKVTEFSSSWSSLYCEKLIFKLFKKLWNLFYYLLRIPLFYLAVFQLYQKTVLLPSEK